MKKLTIGGIIALALIAVAAVAGPVPNAWYRAGNVDIQGLLYTGTSNIQLTNADGTINPSAFPVGTGPYVDLTSPQEASGAKTWDSAAVFLSTLGATGAVTLQSTEHVVGAATLDSTLAVGAITTTGLFSYNNITNTITAHSGGGQGSAVALTAGINNITTVAAGGDSVKLPTAAAGLLVVVSNSAAANTLSLFPNSTNTINGGSGSAAVSVVAKGAAICFGLSTTAWACSVAGAATFP